MAYSRARTTVSGRHSRPPGVEEVRRTCLAVLTMLIAQYALGIFLNLFVTVPASDKHASMLGEITSGPFALTVHAVLGLSLLGTALLLLVRVVRVEDPVLIALATGALGAIGGAFAAGEIFVKDGGQDSASFTMALLAGVAMLCYVGMLGLVSAPQRRRAHAREPGQPAHSYPRAASGLLADPAPDPEPEWTEPEWTEQGWTEQGWTEQGWTEQGWTEDPWAEPAWSEQTEYNEPPPLPVRRRPEAPTAIGVTWEAPWSQREWP
jgi:hypothetical protein